MFSASIHYEQKCSLFGFSALQYIMSLEGWVKKDKIHLFANIFLNVFFSEKHEYDQF